MPKNQLPGSVLIISHYVIRRHTHTGTTENTTTGLLLNIPLSEKKIPKKAGSSAVGHFGFEDRTGEIRTQRSTANDKFMLCSCSSHS